jgi:DNA-binding NtrC family response regulator
VRELYNALERMVILCDSESLSIENLPAHLVAEPGIGPRKAGKNLTDTTEAVERELICKVLATVNFNKALAAKKLGIPRSTLYYKLKNLQITVEELTNVSKS